MTTTVSVRVHTYSGACGRTRDNGIKLKEVQFRLVINKIFSAMRIIKHLNRLPPEAVQPPSSEVLKT